MLATDMDTPPAHPCPCRVGTTRVGHGHDTCWTRVNWIDSPDTVNSVGGHGSHTGNGYLGFWVCRIKPNPTLL